MDGWFSENSKGEIITHNDFRKLPDEQPFALPATVVEKILHYFLDIEWAELQSREPLAFQALYKWRNIVHGIIRDAQNVYESNL